MVAAVRQGTSMRSVARRYGVSLCIVRWWVRRAQGHPLERVDWSSRPPIPKRVHRTERAVEDLVLTLRRDLKEHSDRGEFGARAIYRELLTCGHPTVLSLRTIGRILERRGALDGRRRIHRRPPPRGWYLPDVAPAHAELDSFDLVEGLALPVFVPPYERGFQAAIENFNGRWQAKVWVRVHHDSLGTLQERSQRYIAALRRRMAERIDAAPTRRPFPASWQPDLQAHPQGQMIFVRRTSEQGNVSLLGHTFAVDPLWPHRLVRCEVQLNTNTIRFYALRRRAPTHQPLLREIPYVLPRRRFHG
jgi:hypothetical protein